MFVRGSWIFCPYSQGSYMKVAITGTMPSTLSPPCFTHCPMSLSSGGVIIFRHSASSTKLEAPLRTGCSESRPSTFAPELAQSRSSVHGHRTNEFNHLSSISLPSRSLSNLRFFISEVRSCYIAQAVLDSCFSLPSSRDSMCALLYLLHRVLELARHQYLHT